MTTVILEIAPQFYGDIEESELSELITKNRDLLKENGLTLIQEIAPNTDCHKELWSSDDNVCATGHIETDVINTETGEKIEMPEVDWFDFKPECDLLPTNNK